MVYKYISADNISIHSKEEADNLLKMLGNLQDEILVAQRELFEQNNFLKSIIINEPDCVCVIARQGHILDINPAGLTLLEIESLEEIPKQGLSHYVLQDYLDAFQELLKQVLEGSQAVLEFPIHSSKNTLRWLEIHANPWRRNNGENAGIIALLRDVTEIRRLRHELEQQARVDYLTGLSNRRFFMEQANNELARASRYNKLLSLMILDIDHFKRINDSYGHQAGDRVLEKLAEICKLALREADTIGRIGGEEFAILLPETSVEKAYDSAERLRELIESTGISIDDEKPLHFTISIGISTVQNTGIKLDQLLHRADNALYEAKKRATKYACIKANRE